MRKLAMDNRIEVLDSERQLGGIRTALGVPYVVPEGTSRTAGLVDGNRVIVYEMEDGEVLMEAEAIAVHNRDRAVWELYLDWATEKTYPYRKPAHATSLIMQGGEAIGETRIRRGISPMATIGTFKPYAAYERLRPYFQRYFDTPKHTAEVYAERDALGMSLVTLDGRTIPVEWIEIGDAAHELPEDEAYRISFPTPTGFFKDASFWEDDEP